MNTRSITRIIAAVIATIGLCVLVAGINAHGDNVQRGFALGLTQKGPVASSAVREAREPEFGEAGGGLDLVDRYRCPGGPLASDDISGWVGVWLLTLLIGGLPTAVLLRSEAPHRRRT